MRRAHSHLLALAAAVLAAAGGLAIPTLALGASQAVRQDSTPATSSPATTGTGSTGTDTGTTTTAATTTTVTTTPVTTTALPPATTIPATTSVPAPSTTNPASISTKGTVTTVTPQFGLPYQELTPYVAQPPTAGALETDGQTNRYTLGGTWLYRADPSNIGISEGYWRDTPLDSGWSEVAVPNAWNAGNYTSTGFAGTVGWYRRDFTLPPNAFATYVTKAEQSWEIEFESVNYAATVWLNGHELGTHNGAYLPFTFAARYMVAGVNRLVIRIDDTRTLTSFPAGPQSGWWNFGGILDGVYLHPIAEADLQTAAITPTLKCATCSATINEQATVVNESKKPETVKLIGRFGSLKLNFGKATIRAGATWSPTASAVLAHPNLWAPGNPYLYAATLTLENSKGQSIGGYSYRSGVRLITWQDGLLYLNGRQLHLRGVSIHEQTVQSGAALDVAQQQTLIGWVKSLGADIIREHYPLDPEAEEMADEDGILLWSEVPVYGSLLSATQANADLASASYRAAAVALLKNNIETNENHPSILVWSIANELPPTVSAAEATYIKQAAAEVHSLDPTRPAAMAVIDWPGLACQSTQYAPLDVIGINEYFGWVDEAGGGTEDRAELLPFMNSVRNCYSDKVLMVTEMGYGGNRTGPVEVRGTYAYQQNNMEYAFGVMNQLDWLAGALWFPMQDFAAEPGYDGADPLGTPPFVDKGVIDQFGNLKPAFATMQAIYQGTTQIAPALKRR